MSQHHTDLINIMSVEEKWPIGKFDGNNYAT